ncbi:MAG: selenocysteine-specific translation elongation factor [Candidatus Sumerlaeia bacterium]
MPQIPPGQIPKNAVPEVLMMICTAGHVDHGKTALVRLLTGCMTDRLKEERDRGLTIELGFAPCFLGNNLSVGIVDVPGHEKFIKNMVAGVSGIGMTLLVIAADDGIMPQTIEHFQIMDLLGVRHGMVALTKTDLVSPEQVQERVAEIATWLDGTWLQDCPICPVSSETFEGYPEFYNTLVAQIEKASTRRRAGIFRMPVERTFRQEGFGSVISGIPIDGTIRVGDTLELLPGGQKGRVRAMQCFGHDTQEGRFGQCLALNIPDFSKNPPERGQVLAAPAYLRPVQFIHVDLKAVPGLAQPLKNAENIKFHCGTIEAPGKIYLLEDKVLTEGQDCLATVALSDPVAVAMHDRFIIRRASPAITVAGGQVLALTEGDRRPRKSQILERLQSYRAELEDLDLHSDAGRARKIVYSLRWDFPRGATMEQLSQATLLDSNALRLLVEKLIADESILSLGENLLMHPDAYRLLLDNVVARIEEAKSKKALSLTVADLRGLGNWPNALWQNIADRVQQMGLVRRRGDTYIIKGAVDQLPAQDRKVLDEIVEVYRKSGFHSPRPDELPKRVHAPRQQIDKMLNLLFKEGELIRLDKNVVIHYDSFKRAQDLVVKTIQEKGALDSNEFKTMVGSSRKYVMAFLDFLDSKGITLRQENQRKLTNRYRENLL